MRCGACNHDVPTESFWHHAGVVPPDCVPLCPPCPGCPAAACSSRTSVNDDTQE
ncbi:hypothetical protein [Kitasatospora arboriphila]|uniref:Uncharacterized protein n=1 Tax=Kitasatospora arboriphila TaxID=258052 RepID=A0ABN1U8D2_9ACTN